MNALVSTALWVVGKALSPVADGVLEDWDNSRNLGLNVKALKMELLLVKATLETASRKHVAGPATEELLRRLRDSARSAEDLLDELDYFRIHDQLHGTHDAADRHAKGGIHGLALNARHTAVSLLGLSSSTAPTAEPGQVVEDARQRVGCCAWHRPRARKPMLGFNRVDFSKIMKHIVEQLQPVRREFTTILQSCDRITDLNIAQSRPITTGRSIEPKLYGRDHIMNSIIHDMTKGKYRNKYLTVLPIVGPGGIGKTTIIQHIYHNEEVQTHFQVVIWVCVSLKFNLNKLLEEIKEQIPPIVGEKGNRPEELIEQRLKSKRLLLVLDDIWECSNEDDWERLLLPLKRTHEKGSMILVTTRFPAVAKMVGTTNHSIELEGLEAKLFRELFHAFVFGDDQLNRNTIFLLETGDKIMVKLKGSPLAAKTVGRLLRKDLSLCHWRRVLENKEWEKQTCVNDIMPALKLSYYYLPFHQQQCFSYSALFPEDYKYTNTDLINLWIGLDILQPGTPNQTLEDTGLSYLNDLVTHGFFKEEELDGCMHYVMHDLLHDLALEVASHECLSVHRSNVRAVEIHPSIGHLSIIIDGDDIVSPENFKSQLRKLKTRLKVKELHTLMIFGEMDENFANFLGDLFREAKALRILYLDGMSSSVDFMLHNMSALLHLRYLCLGTKKYEAELQFPLSISRLYHLRILDLRSWYRCSGLPKDLSNLEKLCHFYAPSDELHSYIVNVGKLILLQELKIFRVKKESEGFELKQLEHLTELRELGIYNLKNIHAKEDASKAKLLEKTYLKRLTLEWGKGRSNIEPDVEAVVLESLQPHGDLQELCIRGHRGRSFAAWMCDKLEVLESLHLDAVSWQCLPPLGNAWGLREVILERMAIMKEFVIERSFCMIIRLELVGLESFEKWVPSQDTQHMFPLLQVLVIKKCPKLSGLPFSNCIVYPTPDQGWNSDWFLKLQELEIDSCPEFLLVAQIPWTETLRHVRIRKVQLLEDFKYKSKSSALDITWKDDLQSLTQLLAFSNLTGLEELALKNCRASGKELTDLLTHLPRLSDLKIRWCENIRQLAVGVDVTSAATTSSEVEKEGDGLLLLPAHLSDSLRELEIWYCPELVLRSEGGDGLHALRSLQMLKIDESPRFLSAINSFPCCLFPSSLQELKLYGVEGMGTLEPLSNLTSLTRLELWDCGEDLRCKGLGPLLTTGGQLRELIVMGSPRFFAGWDPNPRRLLLQEDDGSREEHQLVSPSKLQMLRTDDATGLLAVPICSLLSSSLTELYLHETGNDELECFTEEQEDALHLLVSLQELAFFNFGKLQHLPAGLHNLTNLKRLQDTSCPAVRSLPKDGLPKSLQTLDVRYCDNEELKEQCRGLLGTIPRILLQPGD